MSHDLFNIPKIDSFRGEYRWLSNFQLCTIERESIVYPSTEHAYQAAKAFPQDFVTKEAIAALKKPAQAMHAGRALEKIGKQRSDWHDVKVLYMREINFYKYTMHPDLRDKLLATGEAELIEGNTWGDVFWGVCNGRGENNLGKVLMDIRASLRLLHG